MCIKKRNRICVKYRAARCDAEQTESKNELIGQGPVNDTH